MEDEKSIESQLESEGLGKGTVAMVPERTQARQARRFQLMARFRVRLQRHKEASEARNDATGVYTFMTMARYALKRVANVEPTPVKREAKKRQLLRKWARYTRDLLQNRYR